VSGNTSAFSNVAFASATTSGPPHTNSLSFKVPPGTAPGYYPLSFSVRAANGTLSYATSATVRVLPPAGYATDVNPAGLFELDARGSIVQSDAGSVIKTPGADAVPDFGVPSLSAPVPALRQRQAVVRGPFDPHKPTLGIRKLIDAFKASKNVGCLWVVDYDNALHDPTRGTMAARGTYQIFAYCTPDIDYTFGYELVGHNFNTGSITMGPVNPGTCPFSLDQVDGLFVCTGTQVIPVSPTSGHAEFLSVVILYVGTLQLFSNFPPQVDADRIPVNDRGVVYPKVNVSELGYAGPSLSEPGVIPFPSLQSTSADPALGLHYCFDMGSDANPGCVPRDGAAKRLRAVLKATYQPPSYALDASFYVPHHIQPVCWGGNDSTANGVFLIRDKLDPANYHVQFSAWWRPSSFSVNGQPNPPPTHDRDC